MRKQKRDEEILVPLTKLFQHHTTSRGDRELEASLRDEHVRRLAKDGAGKSVRFIGGLQLLQSLLHTDRIYSDVRAAVLFPCKFQHLVQ